MRNPTVYLKMRVLGAIDMAGGKTIRDRIKAVSQMTFTDEEGRPRQFTWSTISTWLCRYQKHGVTVMENQPRSDKGKLRKVVPEDILDALRQVRPKLHGKTPTRALLYRLCIEQGLLTRSQVAPNTFSRLVNQFELLKPDQDSANKHRLPFAKAHANELWQADTLYGPHVHLNGSPVQTRLIAFIDDASRVCCHGQFFPAENVDTLIESFRAAFYKRGVPHALYVDNGSIYSSKEILQICARVGCLLHHRGQRPQATQPAHRNLIYDPFTLWPPTQSLRPGSPHAAGPAAGSLRHPPRPRRVLGEPGTGKSVLKQTLLTHDPKRMITPVVNRTRHTYHNTLRILCEAFQIEFEGRDHQCERLLVQQAFSVHRAGKMLVPIIDDAHLMPPDCLRKLRLLCEDFPRSHNLILIGQPPLPQSLSLSINEEIRSRVTYSALLSRLAPETVERFVFDQLDRAGLGHNTFTPEAWALIVRSGEGLLRRTRNLCLGALIEAVRDQTRIVDLKQVNHVLIQPHWRKDCDQPIA